MMSTAGLHTVIRTICRRLAKSPRYATDSDALSIACRSATVMVRFLNLHHIGDVRMSTWHECANRQKNDSELDPKREQLIFSLLRERTKSEAARRAGIPPRTVYRRLADADFMAAYRAARRQRFDDAMAVLERNAEAAAQVLVDEIGENRTESFARILAATRLLDRAIKAQTVIAIEEELANLRNLVASLKENRAPAAAVIPHAPSQEEIRNALDEQAEAARLHVAWMAEFGMNGHDIDSSLRYNRPQSVAEEQHLLKVVRQTLEMEKTNEAAMRTSSHFADL